MQNNMHYNSMQQNSQTNLYNYQQPHQHHHHHRRHHHHHHHNHNHNASSYSNHHLNNISNSNHIHNHQSQPATPLLSTNQSSAYFLDRIDLENYTTQTLTQTVENILSKTKSKGLKVKISLPDDGLVIENITDPDQSWIFKTSELLYFWRDPYYLNIIVVITINRSRNQSNRPYSASIFRLRGGTDSAHLFLQQAQQFFSNLSTLVNNNNRSSIPKTIRNKSVEKILQTNNDNNKTKSKSPSINNKQSSILTLPINDEQRSSQPTVIRRITRAEFDPGKTTTTTTTTKTGMHSIDHITSKPRAYSETASSTDSQSINSTREVLSYTRKLYDDEDDKMTTISNNLSVDQVAELMRELKELRNEIAALKLTKKNSPVTRSMSTSPLAVYPENSRKLNDSSITTSSPSFHDPTSQSEVDAETQTDFSLVSHRRRQITRKNKKTMIGSGGISNLNKTKSVQSTNRNGQRTFSSSSTNTVSDQEELLIDRSSQVNDSPNDTNNNNIIIPEQYQPIILAAPPRPILMRNPHMFTPLTNTTLYSNSIEEGSLTVTMEKELPKFLSTNVPSSKSDMIGPTLPIIPVGTTTTTTTSHFRSSLENSNQSTEHIYENVPILIQSNSNQEAYYNIPIINANDSQQQQQNQLDDYVYYTINNNTNNNNNNNNHENESQQQQHISNSPPTSDNNYNTSDIQSTIIQQQKPQIVSAGRHRNQPIYFANHLTNPVFNVDKQLLTNTIANQFGVDLNSPQLQQLITNQHLFVARKRTFANMVWQITPDEELALCSSPISTQITNSFDIETIINSNNSIVTRSILKAKKRFQSPSKRRSISWDNALE